MTDAHEADRNIEKWKMKKLIKEIESARGKGSSMISIILPPHEEVARAAEMLGDEASNMESREAITSAQQRLKLYNEVPPNGLVLYTGTIVAEEGKEKKVTINFEPFKPISRSLYLCDNKFHTEALNELVESDDKFGFIVMRWDGTLFGTLSGNTREVLGVLSLDIPSRSKPLYGYLCRKLLDTCVHKTAEMAAQYFISNVTNEPNVVGLIVAGSADFKGQLRMYPWLDSRLRAMILSVIDVTSGARDAMFNKAIELSAQMLEDVMFLREKKLIGKYFEEISRGAGTCVLGPDDTQRALEMGAVEILIVWEDLDCTRYILKNVTTGGVVTKYLNKEQEANQSNFRDAATDAELQVQDKMPLLEWFASEYKTLGCSLDFVTNKSQEGSRFCRWFGGIGGILRYPLDVMSFDELADDEVCDDSADCLDFHRIDLHLLALS